jgi:hypothetical protein
LSFKIILIQKYQISIFAKCLNLVEFENAFDLNFNLEFKFKSAEGKFTKQFLCFLSDPIQFGPTPSLGLFSFLIVGPATSTFRLVTGPIPFSSSSVTRVTAINFSIRHRT